MATWFLADSGLQATGGALTASSLLTTVTAGAANVVGTWVPMFTATTFPVSLVTVHLGKVGIAVAASNAQAMLDIGTGALGAEVAIAQDIAIGGALAFSSWQLPLSIPVGSRVVVRLRSAVASKAVTMAMSVSGGGSVMESGYRAITCGAVTTGSRGTILTAPASVNVKAAWTVLMAATVAPARFLLVGIASPNTATATAADHLIDIGCGGAGVEAVAISNIACTVTANEELNCSRALLFPVTMPAGTRMVARYQGTSIAVAASPSVTLTMVG
jgi:hypothetical protein